MPTFQAHTCHRSSAPSARLCGVARSGGRAGLGSALWAGVGADFADGIVADPIGAGAARRPGAGSKVIPIEEFFRGATRLRHLAGYRSLRPRLLPHPDVVGVDFQPYQRGHWTMSEFGWTFVSSSKIGWVTDHYGRWVEVGLNNCTWAWLPGRDWSPAWVEFRVSDRVIVGDRSRTAVRRCTWRCRGRRSFRGSACRRRSFRTMAAMPASWSSTTTTSPPVASRACRSQVAALRGAARDRAVEQSPRRSALGRAAADRGAHRRPSRSPGASRGGGAVAAGHRQRRHGYPRRRSGWIRQRRVASGRAQQGVANLEPVPPRRSRWLGTAATLRAGAQTGDTGKEGAGRAR